MNHMKKRLYVAFIILMVPFITIMMFSNYNYHKIKDDGVAINLSGSQRMRTMLISNYLQQYVKAFESNDIERQKQLRELLTEEITIYRKFTEALMYGDRELNINVNKDEEILKRFNDLLPLLDEYVHNAELLIENPKDNESLVIILNSAMELKNQIHDIVQLYQVKYDRNTYLFKKLIMGLILVGISLTIISLYFIDKYTSKTLKKAYYDDLTGLKNRTCLYDNVFNSTDSKNHCIYIDLDNFKDINDLYGHIAGDFVLIEVAKRIRKMFGEDAVYRLGGDEFLVIYNCCKYRKECSKCILIKNKCEAILKEVLKPIVNEKRKEQYVVGCSIGFARPDVNKEMSIDRLIELADVAMLKAKELGKNQYYIATEEFFYEYKENLNLKVSLNNTADNKEFIPYYQPIVDIETNKIKGVESLIRWNKDGQIITPTKFVKLAEASGKIYDIDLFILKKGAELYQELKLSSNVGDDFIISSNFSPYTLSKINIHELVKYIEDLGVKPYNLEIEITEQMLIDSSNYDKIAELASLGFKIAIDDFSAGHSSLMYLKGINFSVLKLDKSLMPNSKNCEKEIIIYKAIVGLARELQISIISEGVETKEQVEFLKSLGVEKVQGYYYSKPVPEEEIKYIIANGKIE